LPPKPDVDKTQANNLKNGKAKAQSKPITKVLNPLGIEHKTIMAIKKNKNFYDKVYSVFLRTG
jgi:hypothetical protein